MTRWSGHNVGHAARVAAVATLVIAVVYVIAAGGVDVLIGRRLNAQVDVRLVTALARLSPNTVSSVATGSGIEEHGQDPDDVPVLIWRIDRSGRSEPVNAGARQLPTRSWSPGTSVTLPLGTSSFRLESRSVTTGGWLVAGESLANMNHVRSLLLTLEVVVGPVVLLAIFLGSWAIGVGASAPVERTRRQQLEFTADASHELRTPLSVIEAEVGLALSTDRPASHYRSSLERVSAESHRLRRIVEDLLWLARFDSQPSPPPGGPVDVGTLAAVSSERFEPVARARRVTLTIDIGSRVPALVKAPAEWLDRLIGVLLDNACRYTPVGGRVSLVVETSGNQVRLAVHDSGPGIPTEERARLFDRFHRATDQPGGAGLGLAIADAVVRSTGGRWKVGESALGGAQMEVCWHRA